VTVAAAGDACRGTEVAVAALSEVEEVIVAVSVDVVVVEAVGVGVVVAAVGGSAFLAPHANG
jgi:putative protein kinase ArgK-like GTPase of G3E family